MQQRYADSGQTLLIELQNYEQQGFYLAGGVSKQFCGSVRGHVCPGRHELYEGLCVPAGCTVPSEI